MSEETSEKRNGIRIDNVKTDVSFRIGMKKLSIAQLKELRDGQIIVLDSHINDPVTMLINGQPKAIGEICEEDGVFAFKIKEILD